MHDYSKDKPVWEEIEPGHFVFGNSRELSGYQERCIQAEANIGNQD